MFITIEGIDGSGKSTQAHKLCQWLETVTGKTVILTREPGSSECGAQLRQMVLNGRLNHPWSEPFLFMLDRAEHVATVVEPALKQEKIVVCERYHDSTLAYQVWGRGLERKVLDDMFKAASLPEPDITLYFYCDVDVAVKRYERRSFVDAIESEGISFMHRIKTAYDTLSKENPKRWIVIDTRNKSINAVQNEVRHMLSQRCELNGR